MRVIDLKGTIFNRLTVISELPKKGYHRYWLCQCICGQLTEVGQSNLRAGKSTSCGCYATELAGQTYKSKFVTHGDHSSRLYRIHRGMLNRCNKSWDTNYARYGAVGIRVCNEWLSYLQFKEWAMSNGYEATLTLDRVDSLKDYCPSNCRWATYQTQTRNRNKQKKPSSSQFIGVSREKNATQWLASICVNTITTRLGYFDDEVAAAKARDQYILDQGLQHFKMNF